MMEKKVKNWLIALSFFMAVALALAIAAIVLATIPDNQQVLGMTRTSTVAQTITGGTAQVVRFETEDRTYGFGYADGIFTALKPGVVNVTAQVSVNVSGTGGGASVVSPLVMFITKNASSVPLGLTTVVATSGTVSSTNTQFGVVSSGLLLNKGDTFAVWVSTPTGQQLNAGPQRWITITGTSALTNLF